MYDVCMLDLFNKISFISLLDYEGYIVKTQEHNWPLAKDSEPQTFPFHWRSFSYRSLKNKGFPRKL